MKVCPECNTSYDEDLATCPADGADLVDAALPRNPALREVLPVTPNEATSMIDLEAIEQARRERMIARGEDPDAEKAAEPEEEEEPHDPDATGTIDLEALEKKRKGKAAPVEEEAEIPDRAEGEPEKDKTLVTRATSADTQAVPRLKPAKKKGGPPVLVLAVLGGALLLAAGLAGGLIWAFGAWNGAVLTVTTVPPGAIVLVDGAEVGRAPLQRRVKVGSHKIALSLEGYEPYEEVVEVPREGLPFMQPLRAVPKPEPEPEPEPAITADALVAEVEALLAEGKLDEAFEKVKELLKLYPADPRGDALLERIVEARMNASEEKRPARRTRADNRPRGERAKEACADGERLYRAGSIPEAKVKLQTCVQLAPKNPKPHRTLARVYQREDNVDRTRYHLQRYLALGGNDPDYKVRRWLEDHPAK